MKKIDYNGWKNSVMLDNGAIEVVVTTAVGPRVIRCGFTGQRNLFAELSDQQGGAGESDWMLRGGHRLWVAPEEKPLTYEPDNVPIEISEIPGGIRTMQPAGPLSGIAKEMDITLDADLNRVRIRHSLRNVNRPAVDCAPWALSVMAPGGTALIPLPPKIAHTDRLTHNQEWSLWGYTDLSDDRWTITPSYLFFRQDATRGPNKLGLVHREGWVAYMLEPFLFVKRFTRLEGAAYPDGGVNFETFSNEDFLEVESLGSLVRLETGATASHDEEWWLFRDVPLCRTPRDVERHVIPRIQESAAH